MHDDKIFIPPTGARRATDRLAAGLAEDAFALTLREHWLTAVDCDHEAKTDTARCFCTVWTGTPQPSVGEAVDEWVEHVMDAAHALATIPRPSPEAADPGREMLRRFRATGASHVPAWWPPDEWLLHVEEGATPELMARCVPCIACREPVEHPAPGPLAVAVCDEYCQGSAMRRLWPDRTT